MRFAPVRRLAAALALTVAAAGMAVVTAAPALAAPGDSGDDGEGGSKSVVEQLEAASKGFVEAQEKLDASKKRQAQLAAKIKTLDEELGPKQALLDDIVKQTYQVGRLGPMRALVTASDSGNLLDRAETLETVAVNQDRAVRDLKNNRDEQAKAKAAVDAEVKEQQQQVTIMAKRKDQAEAAVDAANKAAAAAAAASGSSSASSGSDGGSSSGGSARADSAPRNSDGSLPSEGCTINDPTSGGCITPRMKHAMDQARSDGFTRYRACWRTQNSGEHPKGRACDFAADKNGFGGVATGASRTYGNNLANYFINNSSRLGVLYVIWFKRIWLPSSGWKSYSGAGGDPSSDHTNHVHLSVR